MKKHYIKFLKKNNKKISKIKNHLKKNKKDISGRRGLIKNINLKKKIIKYLNQSGEMANTLL